MTFGEWLKWLILPIPSEPKDKTPYNPTPKPTEASTPHFHEDPDRSLLEHKLQKVKSKDEGLKCVFGSHHKTNLALALIECSDHPIVTKCPGLTDLPPEIFTYIISFLAPNESYRTNGCLGIDNDIAGLFQGLGLVSISLHDACTRFIQIMPTNCYYNYGRQLGALGWACRNEMSLNCFQIPTNTILYRSICAHTLSCCRVQYLKKLSLDSDGVEQGAVETYKRNIIANDLPVSVYDRAHEWGVADLHKFLADRLKGAPLEILGLQTNERAFYYSTQSLLMNFTKTLKELYLTITDVHEDHSDNDNGILDRNLPHICNAVERFTSLKVCSIHVHFNANFAIRSKSLKELRLISFDGSDCSDGAKIHLKEGDCPALRKISVECSTQEFNSHLTNISLISVHCHRLEVLSLSLFRDVFFDTNGLQMHSLSEVICGLKNLKRLCLYGQDFDEEVNVVLNSRSLEEIDVSFSQFALGKCICPKLQVLKCTQISFGDSLSGGIKPVIPFTHSEMKDLVNFQTTRFKICNRKFIGLEVGNDCVVEVEAYDW